MRSSASRDRIFPCHPPRYAILKKFNGVQPLKAGCQCGGRGSFGLDKLGPGLRVARLALRAIARRRKGGAVP